MFHVLAHVDVPYPASCFNPLYVERVFEPGLNHAELAKYVTSHAQLAAANALAFCFRGAESARLAAPLTLADCVADDEDARAIALGSGPLAEIVRAQAELSLFEAAPPSRDPKMQSLGACLERVVRAAPMLDDFAIEVTPPLGRRGRVFGKRIIVGHPAYDEVELIAWQAAHEATVASLRGGYTTIEREALRLLAERAERVGLTEAHARWFAGLGAVPDIKDGA